MERGFGSCSFGQNDIHYCRNHLTRFFNRHCVSDANVLLANIILVVKRGATDGAAGKEYRLQFRDRSKSAGATDLNCNCLQKSLGLLGGILISNGPPRRFGGESCFLALFVGVQLDHRTISFVSELAPHLLEFFNRSDQFIGRAAVPGFFRRLEPKLLKPLQRIGMALRQLRSVFDVAEAVENDIQWPFGDDACIQLLERAGRGIARIGKGLLARGFAFRIKFLKTCPGEIDLTAHLQNVGRGTFGASQLRWNAANRSEVRCDVIPCRPVASSRAAGESALFIAQINRHPVYFRFDRPVEVFVR